jgi:hypothetical protein
MSKSSAQFTGELGIHYPLHVLNRYSLPELIDLADRALKTLGQYNFTRAWTNDNLEYRPAEKSFPTGGASRLRRDHHRSSARARHPRSHELWGKEILPAI